MFKGYRGYFDGSASVHGFVTLACLGASDEIWQELERDWRQMNADLNACAAEVPHEVLHVKDLMVGRGQYSQWTPDRDKKMSYVMQYYTEVLQRFSRNSDFFVSTVTVDVVDHKEWREFKPLPEPARLCVWGCLGLLLGWHMSRAESPSNSLALIFDQNEEFRRHVQKEFDSKRFKRRFPIWNSISSIAAGISAITPALQMTDLLAWIAGRMAEEKHRPEVTVPARKLHPSMYAFYTVGGVHKLLNSEFFRSQDFPPFGVEADDPRIVAKFEAEVADIRNRINRALENAKLRHD